MDQVRWSRVKEVLGDALELPTSKRRAFLDEVCADDPDLRQEVEGLLEASDDTEDFIETPALAHGDDWLSGLIGSRIGPYRIVELLGEGGMGAVYRGVRDDGDFQQQIAIKLVKRGMDTTAILRRFRVERRILAKLDHPNICKLLDGGVTDDGLPYFVMEYLKGIPIHVYCQQRKLSVQQRLDLFVQVCSAVEYSHRNLVVHRDLKAKNILVTEEGVPKLLDFGIAKVLDRDSSTSNHDDPTVAADRLFTPDYASPEQIRGEPITTAADIYSLGVLLYEIVTDHRPFHLTGLPQPEMARISATQEPPKASSVAPRELAADIGRDLDTIICKAMHKSPDRRYGSAQAFLEDIRRQMNGRPVHARGDTFSYRATKFIQRNRLSVLLASLAIFGLFAGGVTAAWQRGVALSKEKEARKRFGDIRELANSFLGELDPELERLPGSTTAREMLARQVLRYLDELAKDQVGDASLQRDLAVAYERLADVEGSPMVSNLGRTDGALASYGKAITILDQLARERPGDMQLTRDQTRVYSKMSDVKSLMGDVQGAMELETRSRRVREAWLEQHPDDRTTRRSLAANLQSIGGHLDQLGRSEDALKVRRQALAMIEEMNASGPVDGNLRLALALAYKRLGRTLHRTRRYEEAIPNFLKALKIEKEEVARDPIATTSRVNLSFTWNDMGITHRARGADAQALACFEEALKLREDLVKSNPKDVRSASLLANTRLRIGMTLLRMKRASEALRLMQTSLQSREQLSARDPKNSGARAEVGEACAAIADLYMQTEGSTAAREYYRRAYEIFTELKEQGKLGADFRGEPARIQAALDRIDKGVS